MAKLDRVQASLLFPHAIIDLPCEVGDDTHIWHHAHVCRAVRIGARCTIGDFVHIGPRVVVGDGCKIQNGAQLFEGVELGDEVFVGPCAVFTNVVHPRAAFPRRDQFEKTTVGRGATIGANATIRCGITIGEHAVVGAGSVVIYDVQPHEIVVGNPAKPQGWACACGETLHQPDRLYTHYVCPVCTSAYTMEGGALKLTDAALERTS